MAKNFQQKSHLRLRHRNVFYLYLSKLRQSKPVFFRCWKSLQQKIAGVSAIQCPNFRTWQNRFRQMSFLRSATKKLPPLPKNKITSLKKNWQKDTVDGGNPSRDRLSSARPREGALHLVSKTRASPTRAGRGGWLGRLPGREASSRFGMLPRKVSHDVRHGQEHWKRWGTE